MATQPTSKPLPTPKETGKIYKSSIILKAEREIAKNAGKLYGEDSFSIDPLNAGVVEVAFHHEMTQTPVVLYSIQSDCECPIFHFITSRSARGFQVTIHNTDSEKKAEGTVLWNAFVQP